jgi:hypothetical protein
MNKELPRGGIAMIAFLQTQNCSNYPDSWRHIGGTQDFMSAAYYQGVARSDGATRITSGEKSK